MQRRKARIIALELLYESEIRSCSLAKIVKTRLSLTPHLAGLSEFALRLAEGVKKHQERIDELIRNYSEDWALERMPFLDRNILRIALYEMFYEEEIPVSVSINEAVELAKRYGTEDSSKFINGILGKVALELEEKVGKGVR